MANVLKRETQERIIGALVEGSSIRSVERMTGVHRDTIMRLQKRVGDGCDALLDSEMHGLTCKRIQLDEIWGYVGKKQKNIRPDENAAALGDTWTWVALDPDTKIVPTFWVGQRDVDAARAFVGDLASRLKGRVQLSADALPAYVKAIAEEFGPDADFGQIVKWYEATPAGSGRYSPPKVVHASKRAVFGRPNHKHISTSLVERNNLTIRMHMRRMTRLTNGFSKKIENHTAATALHFGYYNFVKRHSTVKTTPAVAAGVTDREWTVGDLLDRQAPFGAN